MKIVTWNVRQKNKKVEKLIAYALRQQPDVLCLQEVPLTALSSLQNIKGYSLSYTHDFQSSNPRHNNFICTLTKQEPSKMWTIPYETERVRSILTWLYRLVNRATEQHTALVTEFSNGMRVVNARLSCAVGTWKRLNYVQTILQSIGTNSSTIWCGDFNIMDIPLYNILTGWIRGFKLKDYLIHERRRFERICRDWNLVNIFRGRRTSIYPLPFLQFDHILVPRTIRVRQREVGRRLYGSDHRMLFAELDL